MNDKDIKTLIEILKHKKCSNLALLLKNCLSEIESSGQFGSHDNSILSKFLIYAPVEQYYKLKELSERDQELILRSILDIYPVTNDAPEIISIDFRILKESFDEEKSPIYIGRTLRVFISYSTEEKELAGDFKRALEELGLEIFLAHEDINPSLDWQKTILENLESTDIFMPIITEKFKQSAWTDQESGIALIKDKFIVPIAIDGYTPYGFLNKFQAFKHNSKLPISASKIVEAIIQAKPRFASPLLDSLIKSFAISHSYDDAGLKSSPFLKFTIMTKEQVNEIFRASVKNDQIFDSRSARSNIKALFLKYRYLMNEDLVEEVVKIFNLEDEKQKVNKVEDLPF